MSMKVQNRGMVFLPHQHKANPPLTHTNSTIDKFMGGESADYILVAEEWPTFLYDEESGWNIKDIRRGLFHGHILARVSSIYPMTYHLNQRGTPCIQVALQIYHNKTAVRNEITTGAWKIKASQAQGHPSFLKAHRITKVTPEMVAYVAVQVQQCPSAGPSPDATPSQTYIGLSAMPTWGEMDGTFSLVHFYHLIIKTLTDGKDPWVVETLSWWQRQVYTILHLTSTFSSTPSRKLFGDCLEDPAGPSKRIILTNRTTYRLMERQKWQADGGEDGQSRAVCVGCRVFRCGH